MEKENLVITVEEIMTTELFTLKENDSLFRARCLMTEEKIRHLPVLNAREQFVGILTHRDVLASTVSILADVSSKELEEMESAIPIKEIMTTNLVVAELDTSLLDAAKHLKKYKYGCLPVVANDKLMGIITETDFVELAINLLEQMAMTEPVEDN